MDTDNTPASGPAPTDILSSAAGVENIVTWVIASSICKDQEAFGLFMQFAADRIPVDEKTRMLGKIVASLPGRTEVYAELLNDLRTINQVRKRVAHSLYVPFAAGDFPAGYVMFRRGTPDTVTEDELQAQVKDALDRVPLVMNALDRIAKVAGFLDLPEPDRAAVKVRHVRLNEDKH